MRVKTLFLYNGWENEWNLHFICQRSNLRKNGYDFRNEIVLIFLHDFEMILKSFVILIIFSDMIIYRYEAIPNP